MGLTGYAEMCALFFFVVMVSTVNSLSTVVETDLLDGSICLLCSIFLCLKTHK